MLLYCYAVIVRVVAEEEKGYDLPSLFAVMAVRKEFGRGKRMIVLESKLQCLFILYLYEFYFAYL